jgi:hypothetical protein
MLRPDKIQQLGNTRAKPLHKIQRKIIGTNHHSESLGFQEVGGQRLFAQDPHAIVEMLLYLFEHRKMSALGNRHDGHVNGAQKRRIGDVFKGANAEITKRIKPTGVRFNDSYNLEAAVPCVERKASP